MSNIFTSNWKHFLPLSSYFWKTFFSEPHICFLFCFFVSLFLTVMFRNTTTCQMWDKPGLAVKRNRKRRNKRRSYESRQKGAEARHLGMKVLQVWFSVVQILTGIARIKQWWCLFVVIPIDDKLKRSKSVKVSLQELSFSRIPSMNNEHEHLFTVEWEHFLMLLSFVWFLNAMQ